jgi:DNA invertase Pin-like site-specific DNA recombinase
MVSDRPELAKLLNRPEESDLLVVTRLDRLARSTRDLLDSRFSLLGRRLGQYDHTSRAANAHGPGRSGRI